MRQCAEGLSFVYLHSRDHSHQRLMGDGARSEEAALLVRAAHKRHSSKKMFSTFSSALKFVLPSCDQKWLMSQKRSRNNDGLKKIVRAAQKGLTNSKSTAGGCRTVVSVNTTARPRENKRKDLYLVLHSMGRAGAAEQWAEKNIWEIANHIRQRNSRWRQAKKKRPDCAV